MGETHLEDKETVLKAFVIQRQSILVVSSTCTGTIVRRVDFSCHRRGRSDSTSKTLKRLGRRVALCDFNAEERLLVLVGVDGMTTIFRIRENLSAMEVMRNFDVGILTSLELPLRDIVMSEGVLHMVDQVGAVQTLNTRNLQTSRKQRRVEGSCEMRARSQLFQVLDGAILGWVKGEADLPVTRFQFFAAEDMRVLPQSVDQELHRTGGHMECATFDENLYVVDDATRVMHKFRLEATLKSESYRIRKLGCRNNGAQDSLGSAASQQQEVSDHWLWVLYHLREKFPVCGELFRGDLKQGTSSLALAFVCSCEDRSRGLAAACDKLLRSTSHKLLLLNKPIGGMDLAMGGSRLFCGAHVGSAAVAYYSTIVPLSVNALLRELVTFVPVQLCRAEFNTLTLMNDGQPTTHVRSEDEESGLHATDIAQRLRFGLLSPLLLSWRGQCVVVTSMGKQSTGKSYFLNHLTGTLFAISGARCTDGAWMSVRVLPSRVLLVVMDFEGLGSLERSEQEDVFLSVLNASVSLLTIFRMEMRFDKSIDDLFARFQKGSQLIKRDAQLFRGKLYMSVKDVNPDDQHGVVGEFVTKFERLLGANKERNFLTDLYAGQVDINCSPPLGTVGYYRSLSSAKDQIEKSLCADRSAGFSSGKAFLDCIRLLLAKVAILDWTSLDETAMKFKVAELLEKLPSALRFGSVVARMEDSSESSTRWLSVKEPLIDDRSGSVVAVSTEEVFAANPMLAGMWRELLVSVPFDQVDDETIDFGCVTLSNISRIQAASGSLQSLFRIYAELLGVDSLEVRLLKKSTQLSFDLFLAFLVRRRCLRVRKWCRSVLGDRAPESWAASEQQAVDSLQTTLVRCQDSCSSCHLGCMKACAHAANGDEAHDCGTSHACAGLCTYCAQDTEGELPDCSKRAGHDGYCECSDGDHTCKKLCQWSQAGNCGKLCTMKAGHGDGQEHRCSVGLHKCGEPCAAHNCSRPCVLDIAEPHVAHKCDVDRCLVQCIMAGCSRDCCSSDHFHGHTEAKLAFEVDKADSAAKQTSIFDSVSEKPTIHMCDQPHVCPEMCAEDGICHIDVMLKQSSKTFVGARGSFQYTFQEMNGSRKKCAYKLKSGQMAHEGTHSCTSTRRDDEAEETKGEDAATDNQVRHYCDVRCPCCSYYCQREFGHNGLHKTTHGNMRNTMFVSDDHDIDLMDRKYAAGERGTAEMCNLFCSKMGRGHVHYLDCEKVDGPQQCVYKGSREDMRRHCTRRLDPKPDHEQDELLHERFWDTLGWEDPCMSMQEREEFGKCAFKCDATDHDENESVHCVLPAWHAPAMRPASEQTGFSYVQGHKFACSHVSSASKRHHVFVLDTSLSMRGSPWSSLVNAYRVFVRNRVAGSGSEDLVSVVTFNDTASIVAEARPIAAMTNASVPFRGGGTSFAAGLEGASEILSRMDFRSHRPVVVLFSDGQVPKARRGEQLANHIASTYAKYGLESFVVGFGSARFDELEACAGRVGGSYLHVLSGDELQTTFQSISESIGSRTGLALTKPLHEAVCVICQKELASEATTVLAACQHELHQRCLRELIDNTEEGDAKQCPTCRQEIQ